MAVCKGTICAKFQKPAGYIDLDLGLNTTPVKVFFIPVRAELVESHHAGARVQFHLAFTLDKGYEAYEVELFICEIFPFGIQRERERERERGCI